MWRPGDSNVELGTGDSRHRMLDAIAEIGVVGQLAVTRNLGPRRQPGVVLCEDVDGSHGLNSPGGHAHGTQRL